ncbi:MAG: hypothetical protein QM820_11205 [Minicystis sp.]
MHREHGDDQLGRAIEEQGHRDLACDAARSQAAREAVGARVEIGIREVSIAGADRARVRGAIHLCFEETVRAGLASGRVLGLVPCDEDGVRLALGEERKLGDRARTIGGGAREQHAEVAEQAVGGCSIEAGSVVIEDQLGPGGERERAAVDRAAGGGGDDDLDRVALRVEIDLGEQPSIGDGAVRARLGEGAARFGDEIEERRFGADTEADGQAIERRGVGRWTGGDGEDHVVLSGVAVDQGRGRGEEQRDARVLRRAGGQAREDRAGIGGTTLASGALVGGATSARITGRALFEQRRSG